MESQDVFGSFYQEIGRILENGDTALIEDGPPLVASYLGEFADGLKSNPVDQGYSRHLICGSRNRHVVYVMEWSPGFILMPHEHHGRSCFEFVLSGQHVVSDWMVRGENSGRFQLDLLKTTVVNPGQHAIVDASVTDVHSVYTPVRSTSLHVYPADYSESIGYVRQTDGLFQRRTFALNCAGLE